MAFSSLCIAPSMDNKTVDDTNDALIVATTKVCLLVIDVVTVLGF
jgi:hypothetical protein